MWSSHDASHLIFQDSTCCVWSYDGHILQKFKGHKVYHLMIFFLVVLHNVSINSYVRNAFMEEII